MSKVLQSPSATCVKDSVLLTFSLGAETLSELTDFRVTRDDLHGTKETLYRAEGGISQVVPGCICVPNSFLKLLFIS